MPLQVRIRPLVPSLDRWNSSVATGLSHRTRRRSRSSLQVPGRRLFSEADVERIVQTMKTKRGTSLPSRSV